MTKSSLLQSISSIKQNKLKGRETALKRGETMKTVYISGKMTGLEQSVYERNFQQAELFYRACGYEVVNPCNLSAIVLKRNPDATYEDFMKEDLKALAGCSHIAMLEGWETSPGARRERNEAKRLGLTIVYLRILGGEK